MQSSCVENPSLCYWDGDAAVGMKTVGMQKLPWVENKTSHGMERNKEFINIMSPGGGKGFCWRTELKLFLNDFYLQ